MRFIVQVEPHLIATPVSGEPEDMRESGATDNTGPVPIVRL